MKYNKNTDYLGVIPKTYEFEGVIYQNYDKFTELHEEHGWIDYVEPTYDNETHKLGEIVVVEGVATKEVVALTQEEIAAIEKTKVPFSVTNIQLRKALIQIDIFPRSISQMLNALPEDSLENKKKKELLINMWEYENEMRRQSPDIISFGAGLGLKEKELDNLFILANTL